MSWAELLPNLLIGLREGLEAGLIVTILVSAVRRAEPDRPLGAVWAGVAAAVAVSLSLGAVLTFTSASLSTTAQAAFGGCLSVLAVGLVTWMVFWMRRAARGMAGELRGKVGSALALGGAALVLTVFLAVAREGLETALFVWTNAQAAGSNLAPVLGAVAGLLLAAGLCLAMYRRLVTVNLARFFTVTGAVLLVIAAGVLAYGIGDLQEAGLLPGGGAAAFDLTGHVSGGAWYVEAVRGITNLDLRMTWLQVVAYVCYLAVTLPLLLRGAPAGPRAATEDVVDRPRRGRRPLLVGAAAVVLPVLVAVVLIVHDRGTGAGGGGSSALPVRVAADACAPGWAAPAAGPATFAVSNDSGHAVDVELVTGTGTDLVAEIEVLGPGTTRTLGATLGSQEYRWTCTYDGLPTRTSEVRTVRGTSTATTVALPTVRADDLAPVVLAYRAYVTRTLATLVGQTSALQASLTAGDVARANVDWTAAHLTYHRIGAAYDAFGDAGAVVDGLAQGLPGGVRDADFVGFHKIELELWSGVPAARILPAAQALTTAVVALSTQLPTFTFDPNDISLRTHEILEGTARFQLTGQDDYGSGTSLATALADTEGSQTLVTLLTPMLERQSPGLAARAQAALAALHAALASTRRGAAWPAVEALTTAQRQQVNAATGHALETLSVVPDLLEIRA